MSELLNTKHQHIESLDVAPDGLVALATSSLTGEVWDGRLVVLRELARGQHRGEALVVDEPLQRALLGHGLPAEHARQVWHSDGQAPARDASSGARGLVRARVAVRALQRADRLGARALGARAVTALAQHLKRRRRRKKKKKEERARQRESE